MLPRRKFPEVSRCFGHNIVIELEDDATSRLGIYSDIKLHIQVHTLAGKCASIVYFPHKNVGPVAGIGVRRVQCKSSGCKGCNDIHVLPS
jgi:hypothetical protein